jgi:hypothetical protein
MPAPPTASQVRQAAVQAHGVGLTRLRTRCDARLAGPQTRGPFSPEPSVRSVRVFAPPLSPVRSEAGGRAVELEAGGADDGLLMSVSHFEQSSGPSTKSSRIRNRHFPAFTSSHW